MRSIRLIARLDIKGPNLIKGIRLEGLRVVGDPNQFAKKYYKAGADEIIYMDTVASLYGRNHLGAIIRKSTEECFIPITVGGGIRSISDVKAILQCGADKVAINTALMGNKNLVREVAEKYGSQCMVASIEAKNCGVGKWEAYFNNGRDHSHRDVVEWASELENLGAGEILLTSVDMEGTRKGFDNKLIEAVTKTVSIPVIASGGFGQLQHAKEGIESGTDALAFADCLHYDRISLDQIRRYLLSQNIEVRERNG
jgi:cyclase